MNKWIIIVVFLTTFVTNEVQTQSTTPSFTTAVQDTFEMEEALTNQQNKWVWRSQASGLKTLRLENENQVHNVAFKICIVPRDPALNVSLQIDDIRYSNDGLSDTVLVRFDGAYHAYFYTEELWKRGYGWNVFRNSGRLGRSIPLSRGEYKMTVSVVTDVQGVELDRIRVNAENQAASVKLICGAYFY